MHVRRYSSAANFLKANLAELVQHESEYNLKIGLSAQIAEGQLDGDRSCFFGVEAADGRLAGQALRTSPEKPLLLSHLSDQGLDCLLEKLTEDSLELTGVIGPGETASAFADRWTAATVSSATVQMRHLVYEARAIVLPPSEGGELIVADDTLFELATEWTEAFARECFPQERRETGQSEEFVSRLLPRGLLFFWKSRDGKPVSMAAHNRESPNGATVSHVYTPEHLRRKGYASCVTGYLSQRILDSGKSFCNLFTDASNRSSNRIYKRLGYELIGESLHYVFTPR